MSYITLWQVIFLLLGVLNKPLSFWRHFNAILAKRQTTIWMLAKTIWNSPLIPNLGSSIGSTAAQSCAPGPMRVYHHLGLDHCQKTNLIWVKWLGTILIHSNMGWDLGSSVPNSDDTSPNTADPSWNKTWWIKFLSLL